MSSCHKRILIWSWSGYFLLFPIEFSWLPLLPLGVIELCIFHEPAISLLWIIELWIFREPVISLLWIIDLCILGEPAIFCFG